MVGKAIRYLFYLILTLLVLLVTALFLTQTDSFRLFVKSKLIAAGELYIDGHIEVGELKGNFFTNLELKDVSLTSHDSCVVSFSSLRLSYSLLMLRSKVLVLDSLILDNPVFNIWQRPDSTWNITHLLSPSPKDTISDSSPFPYTIKANFVRVNDGSCQTVSFNSLLPRKVKGLNLWLDGNYNASGLELNLRSFSVTTQQPTIAINQFRFLFKMNAYGMGVDSLELKTSKTDLLADLQYKSLDSLSGNAYMTVLDRDELAVFIPSIALKCSPRVKFSFSTKEKVSLLSLDLVHEGQQIALQLRCTSLIAAIDDEFVKSPYDLSINLVGVRPEHWYDMPSSQAILNGSLQLNGDDLLDLKSRVNVVANLANSTYNGHSFTRFVVKGNYQNDVVSADLDIQTREGQVKVSGMLTSLSQDPNYTVSLETERFDLGVLMPSLDGTIINGLIKGKGYGFDATNREIDAVVELQNSTVYHIPVDKLLSTIRLKNDRLYIDSLALQMPNANGFMRGQYSLKSSELQAVSQISMDSLSFLHHYIELPIGFERCDLSGTVNGVLSSLQISAELKSTNIKAYNSQANELRAHVSGVMQDGLLDLKADAVMDGFASGGFVLDAVSVTSRYNNDQLQLNAHLVNNQLLDAIVESRIDIGDTLIIALPRLEVRTKQGHYYLPDTTQSVQLVNNSIQLNKLQLKDYLAPNFSLDAQGDFTFQQADNFKFAVRELNLNRLNPYLAMEDSVSGLLSASMVIEGNATAPVIKGEVTIDKPTYGGYSLTGISGQVMYANSLAELIVSIPNLGKSAKGHLRLPMQMYVDSTGFVYQNPKMFEAELKMDSFSIANSVFLKRSKINAQGLLSVDVKSSGELLSPQFFGNVSLKNGVFVDPTVGVEYNDINALFRFDGAKLFVDSLQIKQKNGSLFASGMVEFDSTIIKNRIVKSTINAKATNFSVVDNDMYVLQIDGDAFVKSTQNKPEFGGKVRILRSFINLEALDEYSAVSDDIETPMLIEAMNKANQQKDSVITLADKVVDELKVKRTQSNALKNLTGRLRIEIPRNTWIQSEESKIELMGDLDVVKTGDLFELFGNISINRGHYILYGKKFTIKEGEVVFQGGETFDPSLHFNATYTYRGSDKQKKDLNVFVTGLLSEPTINFALNNQQISQSDGISILLTGKTPDETSSDNQNGIVGSVSSNMLAKMVSSQLTKTLGNRLDLDMIEINSTENWQSAAFVVGKYITNDLLVTYQRGIGETEDDEITPETITLEYELNRIFSLRIQSGSAKSSGFDVVLRFEPKKND